MTDPLNVLTDEQLLEYETEGVLVIENVLTEDEVNAIRKSFHNQLSTFGIDHDRLLSGQQEVQSGPRIKGEASTIFYNKWKLAGHLHQKV